MVKTPILEEAKKVEHTAESADNPHPEESRRRSRLLIRRERKIATLAKRQKTTGVVRINLALLNQGVRHVAGRGITHHPNFQVK
jgi:hypothetical protein